MHPLEEQTLERLENMGIHIGVFDTPSQPKDDEDDEEEDN